MHVQTVKCNALLEMSFPGASCCEPHACRIGWFTSSKLSREGCAKKEKGSHLNFGKTCQA